jgi:hypothetical protein
MPYMADENVLGRLRRGRGGAGPGPIGPGLGGAANVRRQPQPPPYASAPPQAMPPQQEAPETQYRARNAIGMIDPATGRVVGAPPTFSWGSPYAPPPQLGGGANVRRQPMPAPQPMPMPAPGPVLDPRMKTGWTTPGGGYDYYRGPGPGATRVDPFGVLPGFGGGQQQPGGFRTPRWDNSGGGDWGGPQMGGGANVRRQPMPLAPGFGGQGGFRFDPATMERILMAIRGMRGGF